MKSLKEIKTNLNSLMKDINSNIDYLYEVATHDEKTGLHNYKFFEEILDIELERAKRGENLVLAMFDLDHFKKINTDLGHIEADKILEEVAKIFEKSIRKSDLVARFGGEEFILMLPLTNYKKAMLVANRIRKKIETKFKKKVTISAGLAEFKKKDTSSSLKERADKALFQAKDLGRNRVCCWTRGCLC